MRHIALDLELEQPYTKPGCSDSKVLSPTIIQVGYCIFENKDGNCEVLATRSFFTNYKFPISQFISDLTGITKDDMANGIPLANIYDLMIQDQKDFKTSRILITWGSGDYEAILKELDINLGAFGRSSFNSKHLFRAYCEANGINPSGGLKKSLHKADMEFIGSAHDALVDAINTARIYCHLVSQLKVKVA